MAEPARLQSYAELLAASGEDPFVRYGLSKALSGPAYALDGAVALVRRSSSGRMALAAFGPQRPLEWVLSAALEDDEVRSLGLARISVPQASVSLLERVRLPGDAEISRKGPGDDWEWMWTTTRPPEPVHDAAIAARLSVLDDAQDAQELRAFLRRVSPTSHATPGSGAAQLWLGLRGPGAGAAGAAGAAQRGPILACGAMEREPGGFAQLSGIAVDPSQRRAGLGRALTAALTRHAIDLDGACTLGMFSDNAAARPLYRSLGYRVGHSWATRVLSSSPLRDVGAVSPLRRR